MLNYLRKLGIVIGVMTLVVLLIALAILGGYAGWRIGGHFGGRNARAIGACVVVVIYWAMALASSDWDAEQDGC